MLAWVVFGLALSSCLSRAAAKGLAANWHTPASSPQSRNLFGMNTFGNPIPNPFRMNTYEKTGEGLVPLLVHSCVRSFALFFTLLPCATTHLSSFQWFAHSLPKHPGCTPERNPASSGRPFLTSLHPYFLASSSLTSFPLHQGPHGGTISLLTSSLRRETFPLSPVSNFRERTTGSTARLIQARDRRPGPLAIRGRHPASDLFEKKGREKGRPGKASSVRLGERSIVGS